MLSILTRVWHKIVINLVLHTYFLFICFRKEKKHVGTHFGRENSLGPGVDLGIGLGIARCLAQAALMSFSMDLAMQRKSQLCVSAGAEFGIKTSYSNADMSKASEIEAMMQQAQSEFGGVDVLVNNAGIQYVSSIEDFPVEKWDAIIAINLTSAFHTTRLALPSMRQKNWAVSSTSPQFMAWSHRRKNLLMSQPNMAWSA